jgi:topoisomerase IA-like protein
VKTLDVDLNRAKELIDEKHLLMQPIVYKGRSSKGTGRFGPFIKWDVY